MPRRQRFKPSRKPKPAIDTSESEIIQPTSAKPTTETESHEMIGSQRTSSSRTKPIATPDYGRR